MNYQKLYNNLIKKAQVRQKEEPLSGYKEKHHIKPRSLGGLDENDNLVELTAREHFLAHYLLFKMYSGYRRCKMAKAYMFMCNNSNKTNGRSYENARLHYVRGIKGNFNTNHIGFWVTPQGKFITVREAAKRTTYTKAQLLKRCSKFCDKIICKTTVTLTEDLTEKDIGKTWRELGFYIEKI